MTARKSTKEEIWLQEYKTVPSIGRALGGGGGGARVNLVQRKEACTLPVPQGCSLALSNHMVEAESKVSDCVCSVCR